MAPQDKIDVLILGSGGREHALLKACLRSPRVGKVRVAPGNGGMALEAECLEVDINSGAAVLDLVRRTGTQFVIVGPEVPLAHGVVDVLEAAGVKAGDLIIERNKADGCGANDPARAQNGDTEQGCDGM